MKVYSECPRLPPSRPCLVASRQAVLPQYSWRREGGNTDLGLLIQGNTGIRRGILEIILNIKEVKLYETK